MRDDLIDKMAAEHFASRPNLWLSRKDMSLLFMAAPGSGKSTLCQKIIAANGATYICNDEIRAIMEGYPNCQELGITIGDVGLRVWNMIVGTTANHFVVFDNTISKYHMHDDSYLNTSRRHGYKVYIVQIDAPKELLVERIRSRADRTDTAKILSELDESLEYEVAARKQVKADYTYKVGMAVDELLSNVLRAYRQIV